MGTVRTHYDNLKVARDAPDLVIRAAYKSLSQRFHPDKNPGDPRAARAMAIINRSYEILSDPQKRREHDAWVAREEGKLKASGAGAAPIPPQWQTPAEPSSTRGPSQHYLKAALLWPFKLLLKIFAAAPQLAILGLIIGGFWLYDAYMPDRPPPPGPKPYTRTPIAQPAPAAAPAYTRPTTAPNNEPWPIAADYVDGYPILANDGLSDITVDNGQNDSDVFVKLVSLDGAQAFPVRQFYVPAHSRITLNNVSAGNYDIRYRDLSTGGLSRSESFAVEQTPTANGIQYSSMTMTLYKVQDGNFQTYDLAESEF